MKGYAEVKILKTKRAGKFNNIGVENKFLKVFEYVPSVRYDELAAVCVP